MYRVNWPLNNLSTKKYYFIPIILLKNSTALILTTYTTEDLGTCTALTILSLLVWSSLILTIVYKKAPSNTTQLPTHHTDVL